jgi:hypothetical protein
MFNYKSNLNDLNYKSLRSKESSTSNGKSTRKHEIDSPYLQKLSHSNLLQTILTPNGTNQTHTMRSFRANSSLGHSRPASSFVEHNYDKYEPYFQTTVSSSRKSTSNKNYEDKFNSKSNLESFNISIRRSRPSSAPIERR